MEISSATVRRAVAPFTVLALAWSGLAAPAPASDGNLAAVGRVGTFAEDGSGGCSAVLVAPDLVLGAGHCLDTDGRKLAFRPGWPSSGGPPPVFPGRLAVRHPIQALGLGPWKMRVAYDVGLLRLEEAVPAGIARPLRLGPAPRNGEALIIAGYRGGQGDRPRQRTCPAVSAEARFVILGCEVRGGESGSAVLRKTADGPEIVALAVVSLMWDGQASAGALVTEMALPAVLEALMAFEAAPPEAPANGAESPRISAE